MMIGPYHISTVVFGSFRLDGGAMFGSVPKNLWSKRIEADQENCIPLVTRSLVIRSTDSERCFLVDVGCGDKWSDKARAIFAIENVAPETLPFRQEEITDIILTHLHFDHAGGISYVDAHGRLKLTYPNAKVFLQKANYENALQPTLKERASYLKENYEPLQQTELLFTEGSTEVAPGLWVHQVDGHTRGQQWVEINDGTTYLLFPTDLIPTAHHLPLPFHMGYDACAETVLNEKSAFLEYATEKDAIVVFEHDRDTPAAKIGKNDRGHYAIREEISLGGITHEQSS